jgi:double-stranded uracil-DNA glycosylase
MRRDGTPWTTDEAGTGGGREPDGAGRHPFRPESSVLRDQSGAVFGGGGAPFRHRSGFTPRLLAPDEERELLALGLGITNIVDRASAAADELTEEELHDGGERLKRKLKRYRPKVLAVLGVGAYRTAFGQKDANLGLQPQGIGQTAVWVMPNPSGLNAHYRLDQLTELFTALRDAVEARG